MTRHLLKLVWRRKRANALLLLEIFVSFIVLWTVAIAGLTYLGRIGKPLGFEWEHLYTIGFDFGGVLDRIRIAEAGDRIDRLFRELRAQPEVVAVAGMNPSPFEQGYHTADLTYQDRTLDGDVTTMTDEGDVALGIRVRRGRWFEPADEALDWTPIVINQRMAEELFGIEDPLGKVVHEEPQYRVVGVIEDLRMYDRFSPLERLFILRGSLQDPEAGVPSRFVLRVRPGTTAELEERTYRLLRAVAPEWNLQIERTEAVRQRNLKLRLAPFIVGVLVAGSLMVMVVLGMIGVFWQSVTGRTDEIGLRRALGSARGDVYRQMLLEIVLVTSIGSALAAVVVVQLPLLGVLGALGWPKIAGALVLALALMYGMALMSGLYPAYLAARVQPAQALHYE